MKTKSCSSCEIEKELSDFNKCNSNKDGLQYKCKDCWKKYRDSHKKEKSECEKEYYQIHPKIKKDRNKLYYQLNKEGIAKKQKEYNKSHKKERNKRANQRREIDINFKVLDNLRTRINGALKNNSKSAKTMRLIGCDIKYLMYHLQCKFVKGMTWDNHGRGWNGKKEWHIDHIKPCALFSLSKPSEQLKCFNYTNLQPLWAKDNLQKYNKIQQQ